MKILLVGNYRPLAQESMSRFLDVLRRGLADGPYEVRTISPKPLAIRLAFGNAFLRKWLGYIDQFVLFLPDLWRMTKWSDLIHIVDHSNAIFLLAVPTGKRSLVTCHDVLAIRSAMGMVPGNTVGRSGKVLQKLILKGITRSSFIVCDSHQTKTELQDISFIASDRVGVIPVCLNFDYRRLLPNEAGIQSFFAAQLMGRPYFFHVGGNQWYKNRLGVIRLFNILSNAYFDTALLVLAGKDLPGEVKQEIRHRGLEDRVIYIGAVSNEELRALYGSAVALLFPSLAEGFGWPIVEAQACGCPVVTSDREPMVDVSGGAALFVNPDTLVANYAEIVKSLINPAALIAAGFSNVLRYKPEEFIVRYSGRYRSIAASICDY